MKYERKGDKFVAQFRYYRQDYKLLAQYERATGYIRITELSNDQTGSIPLPPRTDSYISIHDAYVACIRHLNELTGNRR